jgi:hypothetical protein
MAHLMTLRIYLGDYRHAKVALPSIFEVALNMALIDFFTFFRNYYVYYKSINGTFYG